MAGEGIHNIKKMQRALRLYVKMELFEWQPPPLINSSSFYPEERDIRNYMYNATAKCLRMSKADQENLAIKIENWEKSNSEDSFYFRAYGDKTTSVDHKWRPFYYEHGGNISGARIFFRFVCRYMKIGLGPCNFTNNDLYQSNFSRILPIIFRLWLFNHRCQKINESKHFSMAAAGFSFNFELGNSVFIIMSVVKIKVTITSMANRDLFI